MDHATLRRPPRMLAPFNTSYQIEQIKNLTGTATMPPNLEQAYKDGFLTQEEYDKLKEGYRKANESVATALINAENADQWFKDYEANMSKTQTVDTPTPTVILDDGKAVVAPEATASSSTNSTSIVGLALGGIATVGVLVGLFLYARKRRTSRRRRRQGKENGDDGDDTAASSAIYSRVSRSPRLHHDGSAPWKDDALLAVRMPLESIHRGGLLSRGGFGEVYRGMFKGETVAIKCLLPEKRKDARQIQAFLVEIKFMAALEHTRIVQFVGVAWESLSDLCVVTEFMPGGDLRSLLESFDAAMLRPRGFDADKIRIALHVVHALTYLHSLEQVVLHRDLKSRNILLDAESNAKLTDFGVSRERVDATMTAGVGSSLWMAPEVMLGERYDEKADVFSFGVVLSELDTHQLPYADAREDGTGRALPQTAVLQLVSLGRLQISLTATTAFADMQQLARDCVALDPNDRPTAAQALHRVHLASKHDGSNGSGGLI